MSSLLASDRAGSRRSRRLRRLGLASVLALLSGAAVGGWILLPGWLEARIVSELARRGIDATLDVRSIDADGLVLADVELGSDLRIEEIRVSYSLSSLGEGRVHDVVLRGARWTTPLDVDSLRSSSLAKLLVNEGRDGATAMPFRRLEVVDSNVVLDLHAGSWAVPVSGSVESRGADLSVRARAGDGPSLSVEGSGPVSGLRLSFELAGELPDPLLAELPALRADEIQVEHPVASLRGSLDVRTGSIDVAHDSHLSAAVVRVADVVAEDVDVAMALRVVHGPGEIVVTAGEPLVVRARRLRVGDEAEPPLSLEAASVKIMPDTENVLARVGSDGARASVRVSAGAERSEGFASARAPRLSGALALELGPDGVRVDAPLALVSERVVFSDARVALSRAELELPIAWRSGDPMALSGDARAGGVSWRGERICAASGRIVLARDQVTVDASCRVTERDPARVRAHLRWREQGGAGLDIALARSLVTESHAAHRVLRRLFGLQVTGTAAGELHIDLDRWQRSRMRVELAGGTLVDAERGYRFRGFSGAVALRRFEPLLTDGPSSLSWRGAALGETSFGRGRARVRVERGAAEFEEIALSWGAARLLALPFRLDLEHPAAEIGVRVRGLSVEELVAELSDGEVEASGSLDGLVHFRVETEPRLRVVLGESELATRSPGFIRVRGAGSITARVNVMDELLERRIAGALANFRYSSLSVAHGPERAAGPEVVLRMRGRGRDVPQELDLTVGFRGLQRVLDDATRLWPFPDVEIRASSSEGGSRA